MASTSLATLPATNADYGTQKYWDQRYSKEGGGSNFDWCQQYSDQASTFRELIPDKNSRILMLGCGNSTLSQDMYDDGFKNIVNTDYSGILINQMNRRHEATRPGMEWHEMDIRDLKFEDDSFDVVIDKATMDAMMTEKGDPWNPSEQVVSDCTKEVDEVLRVLKPNGQGTFLYLTFGQPHHRRRFVTRPNTTLEVKQLGDMFHYYLYIVRN